MTSRRPDLARALAFLPADVGVAVREASAALAKAGVRHALCGGVAVSCYAEPRATKDVDFLVGEEAFEHHGLLVTLKAGIPLRVASVPIDTVPLVPKLAGLEASLVESPRADGIPVVSPEALVVMKVVAGRLRDQGDVQALLESGAVDVDGCRALVVDRFPEHLAAFEQLLAKARE